LTRPSYVLNFIIGGCDHSRCAARIIAMLEKLYGSHQPINVSCPWTDICCRVNTHKERLTRQKTLWRRLVERQKTSESMRSFRFSHEVKKPALIFVDAA